MFNFFKFFMREISRNIMVIVAFGGVAALAFAFTEPSVGPTGGTVNAPINTSGVAQTKSGSFTSSGTVSGNIVNGVTQVSSPQYCIGVSCITAWTQAGGGGTITGVTAGSGLTGGGVSGVVTLNAGAGTGITVGADTIGLTYPTKSCGAGNAIQGFDVGSSGSPVCVAVGGGGTPGGANGYVQFNSSGSFGGDSNLFWDNVSKRLGIGTGSPTQQLDVAGQIRIRGGGGAVGRVLMAVDTTGLAYWGPTVADQTWWVYTSDTTIYNKNASGVAIGTINTMGHKLNVAGTFRTSGRAYLSDGSYGSANGVCIGDCQYSLYSLSGALYLGSSIGPTIIPSGNVGIGVSGPSWRLQLSVDSAGKPNGGSWGNSSDERLKTGVTPLTGALEKLTALRGVQFEWKNPEEHASFIGETRAGFIAQDVEKIFPQFVGEIDANGKDKELIADGKVKTLTLPFDFDAYVVEAMKELKAENEILKARVEALEAQ